MNRRIAGQVFGICALLALVSLLAGCGGGGGGGPTSRIAFNSDRDGDYEIYVMNSDGSGQANLTNNATADYDPSFSTDGSKIAFASNRDGNHEIYVMNSDGSGAANITNNAAGDQDPSFGP